MNGRGLCSETHMKTFENKIKAIKNEGLYRSLKVNEEPAGLWLEYGGRKCLNLCSNNYLGLANHPEVIASVAKAVARWGLGSSGSRLLTGNYRIHGDLENLLARVHEAPAALLFSTGYMANVGILQALSGNFKHIFADRLIHASLIDGMRWTGVPFTRYNHLDLNNLEKHLRSLSDSSKSLVITETLFSMEGDFAPLDDLFMLQQRYGFFLYIDEAHSFGGYPCITASLSKADWDRVVIMGTLGKALGGFGAFVVGHSIFIDYLINCCRGFIFTTAIPPALAAAAITSLKIINREPWRFESLATVTAKTIARASELGLNTLKSQSHIVPVIAGKASTSLAVSKRLIESGFYALPVRYPTVPRGSARIRLSLRFDMKEAQLFKALELMAECLEQLSSNGDT